MAHDKMVIVKSDGTPTTPMAQPQATKYLSNVIGNPSLEANLKQSLNQAFDGGGKATGSYSHLAYPILHASSGNGQKSVTLFYYQLSTVIYLIAIGEHTDSSSYRITVYGQPNGQFQINKNITLT